MINLYEKVAGFEIEVRDFGIGLKNDHGLGFGLITARTYVQSFEGSLKVMEHEQGISIIIELPRVKMNPKLATHTSKTFNLRH